MFRNITHIEMLNKYSKIVLKIIIKARQVSMSFSNMILIMLGFMYARTARTGYALYLCCQRYLLVKVTQ